MDKIIKQIELSKLLAGKVLKGLTKEQKVRLKQWETQGNNAAISKSILNAQSFKERQEKLKTINTTEEWTSFLERMERNSEASKKVKRLQFIRWTSAAAAVLVVGLSVLTYFNTPKNNYQTIEASSIAPGTSHAELVLSTGEVVNLEVNNQNTINEGHVSVTNTKGVLEYKEENINTALEVKTNTLKVPRGGEYQIVLADGTKVWLNSETQLTYTVPFTGNERRVQLKGEAYFDVAPNKNLPFIVTTKNQNLKVLGTEFNVTAYDEDSHITSTLVEGKVQVTNTISNKELFLEPNQQAQITIDGTQISKKQVDVYPYIAWKEGRFVFENVPLKDFLSKISRWYDVEVIYESDTLKNLTYTGNLPKYKNMTSILKIIEAEMSINIKIEDNKIIHVFN